MFDGMVFTMGANILTTIVILIFVACIMLDIQRRKKGGSL